MKYFYDTEFLEGPQKIGRWGMKANIMPFIAGASFLIMGLYIAYTATLLAALYFLLPAVVIMAISFPDTPNTIDLISIGMVDENNNSLYLISNEFNLKEAWERYQLKPASGDLRNRYPLGLKEYWIRDNVLRPLFNRMVKLDRTGDRKITQNWSTADDNFNPKNMRLLLDTYGISREKMKIKIISFVKDTKDDKPMELWADYCSYDHVAFCWIFGKMIELPDGFPMYTNDLQQLSTTVYNKMKAKHTQLKVQGATVGVFINRIKDHPDYPKQINNHDALEDAKWGKEYYEFLIAATW
jgi:hypothetical protein